MILSVDPALIVAISTAVAAIVGSISAAAVAIIQAINKRADAASEERQGIAADLKTNLPNPPRL